MKVIFDHQIFYPRYGGASKYFTMMISRLPKGCWQTTALFSSNEYVRATGIFKSYPYFFRGQAFLLEHLNRPYSRYRLSHGDFDVFHQTNFGTYCLDSIGRKPMVTTYHDSNLSTIDPHPEIVARQARSLERADAIVAVSENTKLDALRLFDVDERKIHVIYHGIERVDLAGLDQGRTYSFPYILFVGRRSRYKNFDNCIRAFARLRESYPDIHLVCTSVPFTAEEMCQFQHLRLTDCVHHVFADENTMKRLYRDAEFFVFPSYYEGFGMPILEAWSCGCPVALSDASCFPEIAADAGLYFDPGEVDDMFCKMSTLLSDGQLRDTLRAKGAERVLDFSWEKCASQHMRLYESLG